MRVWLDDVRTPPRDEGYVWHMTAEQTLAVIDQVEFVHFDHDLGRGLTGYDLAKEIMRRVFIEDKRPPGYGIHSGNFVGAGNIQAAMQTAWKRWRRLHPDEE